MIKKETDNCENCALWRLIHYMEDKIRVQCAAYLDEEGKKHGRVCVEFNKNEEMRCERHERRDKKT